MNREVLAALRSFWRTPKYTPLRAWHALGRRYARFGLARAAHEPALAWAERIAAARPRDAETLRALSARFVEWRYARRTDGECDPHPLIRDLRKFRPA